MSPSSEELAAWISQGARLLPAQGPISVFVHHNTLHAFESKPFGDAVVQASRIFDCEPFLTEQQYRELVNGGQILAGDIDAVVRDELGETFDEEILAHHTRGELAEALLEYGVQAPSDEGLDWFLDETAALDRLRTDIPAGRRARILEFSRFSEERQAARALWRASLAGARRLEASARSTETGTDSVARMPPEVTRLADEILIPLTAAFLDQGVARWHLPSRQQGYLAAFLDRYGPGAPSVGGWRRRLRSACQSELEDGASALDVVRRRLEAWNPDPTSWAPRILGSLLALRGWAGMMHQLESRPDRFENGTPPGSLTQYLAVRLIVEGEALEYLKLGDHADSAVRSERLELLSRAYRLFEVTQLLAMSVHDLREASESELRRLQDTIQQFDGVWCRWILHRAMERRHRNRFLDGLSAFEGTAPELATPKFQAVFCLDEREESLRRHLEEVEPQCETFGIAGYFGIPMYFRALGAQQGVPLCPISVAPTHEVIEVPSDPTGSDSPGMSRHNSRFPFSLSPLRREHFWAAPLTAVLGSFALMMLVMKVLFPGWEAALAAFVRRRRRTTPTRLVVGRSSEHAPSQGVTVGFTVEEMTEIVGSALRQMGWTERFSPLILVVGHGSSSLNNPQESAHDCGACGGGRGGPNARVFAQMANLEAVREELRSQGLSLPDSSIFVGAYHNTCDDSIEYYDEGRLPESHRKFLDDASRSLNAARGRDAQERMRRFLDVPTWFGPNLALAHVADRSMDLAQPRPEYGHATNATCVIGRRTRTRGAYLDRRCFLSSYDPTRDDTEGSQLQSVLNAVVPVCAGINLEYYFSYVDRTGYGCGTKLPHNITSLVGVMDGYRSDLRTGLPWQMVEVHEPVRLLVVVEATTEQLDRAIARLPDVEQMIRNGWIRLAALSPEAQTIQTWFGGQWSEYSPQVRSLPRVQNSREWYRGRRGHLGVVQVSPSNREVAG